MKPISREPGTRIRQAGWVMALGLLAGCSASYFSALIQTSRVVAVVNAPGEITVPAVVDQPIELTNPKVQFSLAQKSSPVTITGVTRMVYTATDTSLTLPAAVTVTTKRGTGTTATLLKQSVFLATDTSSVTSELPAVFAQAFLDAALPEQGRPAADSARSWFVDVTLEGTNQLGQAITVNVGIPINITQSTGGA